MYQYETQKTPNVTTLFWVETVLKALFENETWGVCGGGGNQKVYSGLQNLGHQKELLREALYPSGSEEKLMSCFGFVLLLLRKIIDFCERHLEGASRLLPTGSLSL